MFGDLFSQRTNYESGLMYSSRRRFLVENGRTVLEPPPDLQPRQLARRRHAQALDNDLSICGDEESSISSYSIDPKTGRHFDHGHLINALPAARRRESITVGMAVFLQPPKQSTNSESESSVAARRFKKTAKSVMANQYYENTEEYNGKEGWVEETMAGVHYWVNKLTGEVSTENPWTMSPTQGIRKSMAGMKSRRTSSEVKQPMVEEPDIELGTGSLVFKTDCVDVDELFRLLQASYLKNKKRQY